MKLRYLLCACQLAGFVGAASASPPPGPTYTGIDLYTLTAPSGFSSVEIYGSASTASAGQVVGDGTAGDNNSHALLWSGPAGVATDLHPAHLSGFVDSIAFRTDGAGQVGDGFNGDTTHALLWSGTADSAVDLHPTNLSGFEFSGASGIHGTQQVGAGGTNDGSINHALLWNGAADSAVDLHPTKLDGFETSSAVGTNGVQQVGVGYTGRIFHALLWSGTADSAVDLNPTNLSGINSSEAHAISGLQQVGNGGDGVPGGFGVSHALLWNGTADSAVDLSPTNLNGFDNSYAEGTNGMHQVGYGSDNSWSFVHALLWSGTANSAVDLHQLLPAGFTSSAAWSIDAQDHVFGTATDAEGRIHAVEWVPVPEPAAIVLAATGATILFVCSRRRGRRAGLLFAYGVLFGCWSSREATAAYMFTTIADSTTAAPNGTYFSFHDAAISGNTVAFGATHFQNSTVGNIKGIYSGNGGPLAVIARLLTSSPIVGITDKLGRPAISGNSVVFWSHYSSFIPLREGEAVLRGSGASLATVVKTGDEHFLVLSNPLNTSASTYYLASKTAYVPDGIFTGSTSLGGTITKIVGVGDAVPPGGTLTGIDPAYAASGSALAFRGTYGGTAGIFTSSGGTLATIAKVGDVAFPGATFTDVLAPAVSGNTVAFLGVTASASGIFTGSGGPLTPIVKMGDSTPHGDNYSGFFAPAIGGGTVAFRATRSGGGGIYAASGGPLSAVIETGDPLFGSTVASLDFSGLGLDPGGSGNVAFTYGLADGRTGVAIALPHVAGDYSGNGTVGPEDYDVWKTSFGSTTFLLADGNGNHIVDAADYSVWRDHLGASLGSGTGASSSITAAVPEPPGVVLAWLGFIFSSFRAQRGWLCR